jgi:hypothetical protein
MKISSAAKRAFLAGAAIGVIGASVQPALAWSRTVSNMTIVPHNGSTVNVMFPSDGATSGTPNGNATTQIYGDYYWGGAGGTFTMNLQACGICYNLACGSCGVPTNVSHTGTSGHSDDPVNLWTGSQSIWDYFWLTASLSSVSGSPTVYLMGFGVGGF